MNRNIDIDKFQDVNFWRSLCPDLSVTEDKRFWQATNFGKNTLRSDDWELCKALINEDGYFAYDSFFLPEKVDRLADCFRRLDSAAILPPFCFVYDEFWELLQHLRPMLDDMLGNYLFLPAVWAWHVRDSHQTAFVPHRDQVRDVGTDDDEHLDYLTIWIPLTDLDHLSSSICVLPASADPDYDMGTERVCIENLQDIRMLQGKKGSVFCWATGLVHWGTKQSRLGQPRISVGFYVQHADAEILDPPAFDFDRPLTLTERLSTIGQQFINYSRDADKELLMAAQKLVQLTSPQCESHG